MMNSLHKPAAYGGLGLRNLYLHRGVGAHQVAAPASLALGWLPNGGDSDAVLVDLVCQCEHPRGAYGNAKATAFAILGQNPNSRGSAGGHPS